MHSTFSSRKLLYEGKSNRNKNKTKQTNKQKNHSGNCIIAFIVLRTEQNKTKQKPSRFLIITGILLPGTPGLLVLLRWVCVSNTTEDGKKPSSGRMRRWAEERAVIMIEGHTKPLIVTSAFHTSL